MPQERWSGDCVMRAITITRVKSNAVAYMSAERPPRRGRGRPKKYGEKVRLRSLFERTDGWTSTESPYQSEKSVSVKISGTGAPLAAGWNVGEFCRRRPSAQRSDDFDEHRFELVRKGDHSALWASIQNRSFIQAGYSQDWDIHLSLLDESNEADKTSRQKNISAS